MLILSNHIMKYKYSQHHSLFIVSFLILLVTTVSLSLTFLCRINCKIRYITLLYFCNYTVINFAKLNISYSSVTSHAKFYCNLNLLPAPLHCLSINCLNIMPAMYISFFSLCCFLSVRHHKNKRKKKIKKKEKVKSQHMMSIC